MYFELYDIFLLFGICCLFLACFIILVLAFPGKNGGGFSLLIKSYREILIADYKDPRIKFGGPLGIVKGLLKLGIVATTLGVTIRVIVWLVHGMRL